MGHLRTAIDNVMFNLKIFHCFYNRVFMYDYIGHLRTDIDIVSFFLKILINLINGYLCVILYGPFPNCHK